MREETSGMKQESAKRWLLEASRICSAVEKAFEPQGDRTRLQGLEGHLLPLHSISTYTLNICAVDSEKEATAPGGIEATNIAIDRPRLHRLASSV